MYRSDDFLFFGGKANKMKGIVSRDLELCGTSEHELCNVRAVIPKGTEVQKFVNYKLNPISRVMLGVGKRILFGYKLNSGGIQLIYDPFEERWKAEIYGKAISLKCDKGTPMQHMLFPHSE